MAELPPPTTPDPVSTMDRLGIWMAILLTTGGLLSAWASFQAGRWNDAENEAFHTSNAELTRSSELAIAAGQREAANAALFLSWLGATAEEQTLRADYLMRQFEPPFDAEFRRWRSSLPSNLKEGRERYERPQFFGLLSGPSEAARAEAEAARKTANRSGRIAKLYERWTVILALALYLAGMASVMKQPLAQKIILAMTTLLTLVSMLSLAFLPIDLGV
jgi:hypothetical protein